MIRHLLPALLLLAALPVNATPCGPGNLTGKVTYVRDGDEIELDGVFLIRLQGVAAPTLDEPGGVRATAALREMVLGEAVRCELSGWQSLELCVAICYLKGGDVAAKLVSNGLARDCVRYSGGRYEAIEQHAGEAGATIKQTYRLPGYCSRP